MCAALTVGLEGVLQAGANTRSLARAGRMVGTLTEGHIAQTLKPPGADPRAGWCGRGAADNGCALCRFEFHTAATSAVAVV